MKRKYILPILFISLLSLSCSTDNDDNLEVNEIEGLIEVKVLSNDTHNIEIYNTEGQFTTGYNALSIRIKDKLTNSFVENASLSWIPIMQMPTMQHSCPKSAITKAQGKDTVFEGYIIYQMTNPDGSGWSLTINYTIDEVDYSVTKPITVLQSENQNVTSFMASDNLRYIIALIEPSEPIIGINNMMVGLYKMETMMSFPVVEDYTIMLDPRMPGMGNHGSPNNTDLTFNFSDKMYHGNLSLTMTGYWVLNLKLMSDQDELLKGEDVSESNIQSSLYLELEF